MTDPAAPAPEVVDLMEALRLSLVQAKERREAKTAAPAPEVDTAAHARDPDSPFAAVCLECKRNAPPGTYPGWPCEIAVLADALDAARSEVAERRAQNLATDHDAFAELQADRDACANMAFEAEKREAALTVEVARLTAELESECRSCGLDSAACAAASVKCCPECCGLVHQVLAVGDLRHAERDAARAETAAVREELAAAKAITDHMRDAQRRQMDRAERAEADLAAERRERELLAGRTASYVQRAEAAEAERDELYMHAFGRRYPDYCQLPACGCDGDQHP